MHTCTPAPHTQPCTHTPLLHTHTHTPMHPCSTRTHTHAPLLHTHTHTPMHPCSTHTHMHPCSTHTHTCTPAPHINTHTLTHIYTQHIPPPPPQQLQFEMTPSNKKLDQIKHRNLEVGRKKIIVYCKYCHEKLLGFMHQLLTHSSCSHAPATHTHFM